MVNEIKRRWYVICFLFQGIEKIGFQVHASSKQIRACAARKDTGRIHCGRRAPWKGECEVDGVGKETPRIAMPRFGDFKLHEKPPNLRRERQNRYVTLWLFLLTLCDCEFQSVLAFFGRMKSFDGSAAVPLALRAALCRGIGHRSVCLYLRGNLSECGVVVSLAELFVTWVCVGEAYIF